MEPQDIHNVIFSRAPLGSRGYNEDEVDSFLDLVANEFEGMRQEIEELRSRPLQAPQPNHGDQVMKVLSMAQEMADKLSTEAKLEADAMVRDSRVKADQLVAEARSRAYQMTQDAEQQRAVVLGSVETDKAELEHKIEELRTFETNYRSNLKTYLETLQKAVETTPGDVK